MWLCVTLSRSPRRTKLASLNQLEMREGRALRLSQLSEEKT